VTGCLSPILDDLPVSFAVNHLNAERAPGCDSLQIRDPILSHEFQPSRRGLQSDPLD